MTKFYTKGTTRMYSWENIEAWAEAEENLGLNNSLFFVEDMNETDTKKVTQWVDVDEGEKFFEWVKYILRCDEFEEKIEEYFEAIKEKNKVLQFMALTIFNEIDEHPEIATEDQLRRLKRIRESTHEEIYKL